MIWKTHIKTPLTWSTRPVGALVLWRTMPLCEWAGDE